MPGQSAVRPMSLRRIAGAQAPPQPKKTKSSSRTVAWLRANGRQFLQPGLADPAILLPGHGATTADPVSTLSVLEGAAAGVYAVEQALQPVLEDRVEVEVERFPDDMAEPGMTPTLIAG
jgi:hypothetical protein